MKDAINWTAQWESFAPNFYDGVAHIDLSPHGTLLLEPGEGFGDLSHPTTKLTLDLLRPLVTNEVVIDIGCGSGILSLAALILGAKKVYGIDIDPGALQHASFNAQRNSLEKKAIFSQKWVSCLSPIILMNMIFSEQRVAFPRGAAFKRLITSGILVSEEETYLDWAQQMGWELVDKKREENWMGFIFQGKYD